MDINSRPRMGLRIMRTTRGGGVESPPANLAPMKTRITIFMGGDLVKYLYRVQFWWPKVNTFKANSIQISKIIPKFWESFEKFWEIFSYLLFLRSRRQAMIASNDFQIQFIALEVFYRNIFLGFGIGLTVKVPEVARGQWLYSRFGNSR